jgi:hypothetical protein
VRRVLPDGSIAIDLAPHLRAGAIRRAASMLAEASILQDTAARVNVWTVVNRTLEEARVQYRVSASRSPLHQSIELVALAERLERPIDLK